MRPIGRSQRAVRVEPLRWSPNKCNSGHCDNYTRWRHARPSAVSEHANAICYALTGCPLLGGQMRGLSVDNCLVKVIMFSNLPPMPDWAIDLRTRQRYLLRVDRLPSFRRADARAERG